MSQIYKMKKLLSLLPLIIAATAQGNPRFAFFRMDADIGSHTSDTIFYDKYDEKTSRDSAKYYCILRAEKPEFYSVNEYYIDNNQLKMTGHYSNFDSAIKEGPFFYFSVKGALRYKGVYHNNREDGKWEYYYDTLNTIWYTCDYVDGHRQGELTSYYLNGKIKRKEYHKFIDSVKVATYDNGKKNFVRRSLDSVIAGKCYDENGNEIAFTPFEIMPKIPYDYAKYLSKTLKYPLRARKNNIEGRVVVKFMVSADGTITDVHVVKHVSSDIDEEAVRVISQMPQWEPGKRDDKSADVFYTLPLVFKLD